MYDPVALARRTEALVASGDRRKYWRFRKARFYGGIATADCVGCCLRCAFCWGYDKAACPTEYGETFSAAQVAERIRSIARKRGYRKARLSGNEPTLARAHLTGVLRALEEKVVFILETNGILIGHDPDYARELSAFANLHVRVSLKGATAEEFSALTGAVPAAFELPFKALEGLVREGVSCHAAVVTSLSSPAALKSVAGRLSAIHPTLHDFEEEEIFVNQAIQQRIDRALAVAG